MNSSLRRLVMPLTFLLLVTGATRSEELGTVHYQVPGLQILDARSETIDSGALVRTVDEAAIVHLDNGQVLRLDANTAVKLAAVEPADVKVMVLSGRVLKWGGEGRALAAAAGSWFLLEPATSDPMTVEMLLLAEPDGASARGARAPMGLKPR